MRTITEKFKVYKFNEASIELRDKIRDNIHFNWDIYEYYMQERIETLEKFAEFVNGTLDYSISCVPDRGEFIKITDFDDSLLLDVINLKEDCPLTGVCYDDDLLHKLKVGQPLSQALNEYLESIHKEYEYMLTDEYLCEFCEANDYEFKEDGTLY